MDSGEKHLRKGRSLSLRLEICNSGSGVLSAAALATVYQKVLRSGMSLGISCTKQRSL